MPAGGARRPLSHGCRVEFAATARAVILLRAIVMLGRIALGLLSVAAACATWSGRPHAGSVVTTAQIEPTTSIFAEVLPRDHPMIAALDAAYRELELAMKPHGCVRCHAPELAGGGRRAEIRRAVQVLDSRRAIDAMLEANLMPPETKGHPAGIADGDAHAGLVRRAKIFRTLGDAALSTW